MRPTCRLAVACLLLSTSALADLPSKYLHPVPALTHPCYRNCSGKEAICTMKTTVPGRQCDDGMRLCVQGCDPQLVNSIVLDELERVRNSPERGAAFQNGIAGR